jgi:prephenate dehydrogenase
VTPSTREGKDMAEKLQITIIGLGLVGASAGLALRRYPEKVRVIGHDKNSSTAGQARSMGAVEKTEWNLINSVSGADRILLATPLSDVRDTLKVIAQDLKPGCLIFNMSGLNTAASGWATEYLPANVSFVGAYPVQISQDLETASATADLFQGKMMCLTPDARTADAAATLAADLAEALGAKPFFLDPAEFDGLVAAVEQLPLIMAGALLQATTGSPVWGDMRKLAGSQFYTATQIVSEDAQAAASACAGNRDNLVRWIEILTARLDEWRQALSDGKEETLAARFEDGLTARRKWLQTQASGNWSEEAAPEIPGASDYLRGLIGLRGMSRANKKTK